MPDMNGKELFHRANEMRFGIKALYMSGYTGKVIADCCLLDKCTAFIPKPFTAQILNAKIREVLER